VGDTDKNLKKKKKLI